MMAPNGRSGRPGQSAPAPITELAGPSTTTQPQGSAPHRRPRSFTPADPSRPRLAVYRRREPTNTGVRAMYLPVVGVLVDEVLDLFGTPTRTRTVWAVDIVETGEIRAAADIGDLTGLLTFLGVYPSDKAPHWTDAVFEVDG